MWEYPSKTENRINNDYFNETFAILFSLIMSSSTVTVGTDGWPSAVEENFIL